MIINKSGWPQAQYMVKLLWLYLSIAFAAGFLACVVSLAAHAQAPGGAQEDGYWSQEALEKLDPRCKSYPAECRAAVKEAFEFRKEAFEFRRRQIRESLLYRPGPSR